MGKQYNKVEKRTRRKAYLQRKKEKAKQPISASKSRARKAPTKKKEAVAD
jgi:hypothetical protein